MSRARKPPSPFDRLAELQKEGKLDAMLPRPDAAAKPKPTPARPATPPAPVPTPPPESEADLLRRAMAGVRPMEGRARVVERALPDERPLPRAARDDAELLRRAMADVDPLGTGGGADFIVDEDAGRIEGHAPGVDARTLRRLRTGDDLPAAPGMGHPLDAVTLDLHGLRAAEVAPALARFLRRARDHGRRHVLVVTGRGHGSEGGQPVVRGAAVEALRRAPDVLAFTTAASLHGGAGALYVLLRRSAAPAPSRRGGDG
jgi:DNA-nicking Smr family endonuclease